MPDAPSLVRREVAHLIVGTFESNTNRDRGRSEDAESEEYSSVVGCERFNAWIQQVSGTPDASPRRIWSAIRSLLVSEELARSDTAAALRHLLRLHATTHRFDKKSRKRAALAVLGSSASDKLINMQERQRRADGSQNYSGEIMETLVRSFIGISVAAVARATPESLVDSAETKAPETMSSSNIDEEEASVIRYWRAHWGPERAMFSIEGGGAPYPVFNSIIDNPSIGGDERNFVGLRHLTGPDVPNVWQKDQWARGGEMFVVRVYVSNSGWDTNGVVTAGHLQKATVRIGISRAERETSISATLSAVNAKTVWDGVTVHHEPGVLVEPVPGTSLLENNAHPNDGYVLNDDILFDRGAQLGYERMDGNIPPGYQYAAYVTIRVVATIPSIT